MRTALAAILMALAPMFVAGTSQAQSHDFSGEYVMTGKGDGPRDSAYKGSCSLKKEGKGYEVSCLNTDTSHTYVGKGLALGNGLAIIIGDQLIGDHGRIYEGEYLVVYEKTKEGNLVGRWVDALSGQQGNETLTPKK